MTSKLTLTAKVLIVLAILSLGCAPEGPKTPSTTVTESKWKSSDSYVFYEGKLGQNRYRIAPCVTRLLDGTIIVAVEPTDKPLLVSSTDGGKTFSKPYRGVLPENLGAIRAISVRCDGRLMTVLCKGVEVLYAPSVKKYTGKLPDGREYEAYEGYSNDSIMYLAYSSDQGKTWTAGNKIDYSPMIGVSTWEGARILELDDGTLAVPIAGYVSKEDMSGIWISNAVLLSKDDGLTWTCSVMGRARPHECMIFSEPSVAKLNDGTLVSLMRTEDRVTKVLSCDSRKPRERCGLHRSISTDNGKTWSTPIMALKDGTHCSLTVLNDGVLLCGYHSQSPRLAFSADGGENWYENTLWAIEDPTADWGYYTSVEQVDKNTIIALVKEYPAPNIIRACLLHRQP